MNKTLSDDKNNQIPANLYTFQSQIFSKTVLLIFRILIRFIKPEFLKQAPLYDKKGDHIVPIFNILF